MMPNETACKDVVGIFGMVDDFDDGGAGDLGGKHFGRRELDEQRRSTTKPRERIQRLVV